MICLTDSVETATILFPSTHSFHARARVDLDLPVALLESLYDHASLSVADLAPDDFAAILVAGQAARSQYDTLIDLMRKGVPLPNGLVCLAGQGRGFHGLRDRAWASPPGNIYMSVHFSPNCVMPWAGSAFMMLAAVAALRAIEAQPGLKGRADIKWVNDILIDGAKVCGVLAHTAVEGDRVTDAVLGIGLNVLSNPSIPPTRFVPRATALRNVSDEVSLSSTLSCLLKSLRDGYRQLLAGQYQPMLDEYCGRSLVIGRRVEVRADRPGSESQVLASGVVSGITDRLELLIEGRSRPVTAGRVVLEN